MMELEKTLLQMGARPHRRGYLQAVELLRIFRDKPNISSLQDAYQEAGANLEATPQQMDRNLREMSRNMGCRQSRIAAAVHAMVQEEWTAKQQGFSLHIWRIAAYWGNK